MSTLTQTFRRPISPSLRALIIERDGSQCLICGSFGPLHIDHIIPVSKGGHNTPDNLRVLCQRCNLEKGADDFHPSEFGAPGIDEDWGGEDLTNSIICWNAGWECEVIPGSRFVPGDIILVPFPDNSITRHVFTWGAGNHSVASAPFFERRGLLFQKFVELTVIYAVPAERVNKVFMRLAEYRGGLSRWGWPSDLPDAPKRGDE